MAKATLNGKVVAESDSTLVVEGNHYFPPESIKWEYFSETDHSTTCGWKGQASYYTVSVGDETHENVAWSYIEPYAKAENITKYVAFYPKITVEAP